MLQIDIRQLVPISAATLFSESIAGIDIYAGTGAHSEPILFCSKEETVSRDRLKKLTDENILKLYVAAESYQAYQVYLREHWEQIADNKQLSTTTRTTVLNEVMRDVLSNAFRYGNTETIVEASQSLGEGIVKIVGEESLLVSGLYDVLHHDYATFTHSANVACYAVLLAKRVGYSADDQHKIAVAALLHDIGKLAIDDRILRKPGRLDEFEFRAIKLHPLRGYRQLASREDLDHAQLMMVYQHHEKLDGTGYPVGLVGDEIHPWAKLCAVVDVFEALTSTRPYRSTMTHAVALSILEKSAGNGLDPALVRLWSDLVHRGSSKR